jgi:hypothetical protein
MKLSEKLIQKIKQDIPDLHLPEDVRIRSLHRGPYQVSAGMFSFVVEDSNYRQFTGSEYTVTDLVKCKKNRTTKKSMSWRVGNCSCRIVNN